MRVSLVRKAPLGVALALVLLPSTSMAALILSSAAMRAVAADRDARFRYISPRPGAEFVSRHTTIAVRTARDVTDESIPVTSIEVEGSRSGRHRGQLRTADDCETLIFLPDAPFAPGEEVDVRIRLGTPGLGGHSFRFVVSPKTSCSEPGRPARYAPGCCEPPPRRETRSTRIRDPRDPLSLPLSFPPINVSVNDNPEAGFVFVAPFGYLLILDDTGYPVFFRQMPTITKDFKKQPTGLLTYFDYANGDPRPWRHVALDSTYTVVDEWTPGNGYEGLDFHDLQLLPNGHALILIYDSQIIDMSQIVPGGCVNATVIGAIIQELDPSKNVVFQWRSWDHFEIIEANMILIDCVIDYVHANAIEMDVDGNLLLSSRSLEEVTKIDRQTGNIIWRMGGSQNEFTLVGDTKWFSRQHSSRRTAAGTVTLFDNGVEHMPQESRAIEYDLDEVNKVATLVWEHRHIPPLYARFTGNTQRLPGGNTLISWGGQGIVSEVRPDGTTLFEMNFETAGERTYRAFRFPWSGKAAAPTLWADPADTTVTLHFTKWGDPDVALYNVYADITPQPTTWAGSSTGNSFTLGGLPWGDTVYCRVTAEDALQVESPYSNELQVVVPPGPVAVEVKAVTFTEVVLHQNRPNPFAVSTVISFVLAEEAMTKLAVYDVRGRLVKTLARGVVAEGGSRVVWDGTDRRGKRATPGVYFYRLRAGDQLRTRPMLLLR